MGVGWTLNGVASALGAIPGDAAFPSVGGVTFLRSYEPFLREKKERIPAERGGCWYKPGIRVGLGAFVFYLSSSPLFYGYSLI